MTNPLSRRRMIQLSGSAALAGGLIAGGAGTAAADPAAPAVPASDLPVGPTQSSRWAGGASAITSSSFATPPRQFRPAVRWWWAAPLSVEETVREVTAIHAAGFGEVEIAFSADSWANADQRTNLRAALDAGAKLGMKISMTMGAAWPVQTPNTGSGSGFSQQEMQYGRADVPGGHTFSGALPKPIDDLAGTRPSSVVAATAARAVKRGPAAELLPVAEQPRWGTPIRVPAESTVLDAASLVDLTARVADGKLTWQAPPGDWIVFAFWQRDASKVVTSAFDKNAAAKAAEYLDANQIGPDNVAALRKAGADLFEDSLELNANSLFWAPSFPHEFKARRGYEMTKFLPVMFQHGMSLYWVPTTPPRPDFELSDGTGDKIRNDYYTLLTDLYIDDHLAPFQAWAAKYGLQYKAQAAYGQDLEPIRSFRALARLGGRVEGESYNSGDRFPTNIDNYGWRYALDWQRTIVGGAHQGGATRISTELGAQPQNSGQTNLGDYKAMIDKEWAAGITQPFLHGYQYMSPGAPWPGKYRFGDTSHDSFNDVNKPQWPVFEQATAYWARGTQVLETGAPRTDVAILRKGFLTTAARTATDDGTQPAQLFETRRLERRGFSIQYLDPEGLAEDGTVGDRVLFPEGPQYRCLVIDERALSVAAVTALTRAAAAGVTIVFVGELPGRDTTYASGNAGDQEVKRLVDRLVRDKHVRRCATQGDVSDALDAAGVTPRVAWTDAEVLTQLRETKDALHLFLYNPGNSAVTFAPAFEGPGAVSELDLWTGAIRPISVYESTRNRTNVPITLGPQETRVLALDRKAKHPVHVVGAGVDSGRLETSADGTIRWYSTENCAQQLKLSNGRTVQVTAQVPGHVANPGPYSWSLSVEAYTPSGHKTISIPTLSGTLPLWDWRDRPEIAGESGIGTYTGKLTIPGEWLGQGRGVQLDLGTVEGTAEVSVNGRAVGTQITSDVRWDLSSFLHAGDNELKVVVRTTIRNAVTNYNKSSTRTSSYGLRGPVRVEPFAVTTVYHP
ncbi:glycosyl hydrolase [Amycolatopsis sp. FDAARGOS 1241]|uniref:glycosyl hydrolase n=1 Tax=Amycolatopsis sp. FDAARGOS 1241 TaxID=2778070 RepID=UPI001951CCBA|nr:glycosyl hydrolase [Amycolatopsis sp. FDAARGOS 1241]QRP43064.1 hypothetical protein I6J71_26940 [Amycolatopsis sp. FDAARGOS 1241]